MTLGENLQLYFQVMLIFLVFNKSGCNFCSVILQLSRSSSHGHLLYRAPFVHLSFLHGKYYRTSWYGTIHTWQPILTKYCSNTAHLLLHPAFTNAPYCHCLNLAALLLACLLPSSMVQYIQVYSQHLQPDTALLFYVLLVQLVSWAELLTWVLLHEWQHKWMISTLSSKWAWLHAMVNQSHKLLDNACTQTLCSMPSGSIQIVSFTKQLTIHVCI